MNRQYMDSQYFFTKWLNLGGHTYMQERVTHERHKSFPLFSPSLPPPSQGIYTFTAQSLSFLHWAHSLSFSLFLMHLQYGLLGFMIQHGVFRSSYHLIMKKLCIMLCVPAKSLSASFKPIYTAVLYIVAKERLLNWKIPGSIWRQTTVLDTDAY